jgi:diguanylate cyclase (GGDEF)-like protein
LFQSNVQANHPMLISWILVGIFFSLSGFMLHLLRRQNKQLQRVWQILEGIRLSDNFRDDLTGIPNTKALQLIIEERTIAAQNLSAPLSFLLADMDGFKSINQNYGIKAGDLVLKTTATLLRAELRLGDRIIRYRVGDEFFILAFNTTGEDAAKALGERLRESIQKFDWTKCRLSSGTVLTISIGVAAVSGYNQLAIEQGFKQAEAALLEAKKHKNTVFLYRRMSASGIFNPGLDSQKSISTSSQ